MTDKQITILLFNEPTSYSSARVLSALLASFNIDNNILLIKNDNINSKEIYNLKQNNIIHDNVICINMRRCDFANALNSVDTFVTWVQDEIDWMNGNACIEQWNSMPNDWIIGYTDRCRGIGYNPDKMIEMPFLVLPSDYTYNDNSGINKYNYTDICFASNKGSSLSDHVNDVIRPYCNMTGIDFIKTCELINRMIDYYREGYKICGYEPLKDFIKNNMFTFYEQLMNMNNTFDRDNFINIHLYWFINEKLYRFTVLDWLIKLGFSIKIAGKGWDNNGKYNKYWIGQIDNWNLPEFYRSSKYCLHLNSLECFHHRPTEILMSNGGRLLMRNSNYSTNNINMDTFNKDVYIKQQSNIVKHIVNKIFNSSNEKSPDTSYLYRTHDFGIKFDTKEDMLNNLTSCS